MNQDRTPIRILHIIDSLRVGGAEKLLVSVINNLHGMEHHVISLSDNTELANELPPSAKLTRLGFRSKTDTIRCVRAIRNYIKKHDIAVVHSHLVMSNILARLATPRNICLFNSLHNLNEGRIFGSGKRWQRFIEKLTYAKRHHLIAVSGEVLKEYERLFGLKGPATVLHNFVDDRFFAAEPRKASFTGTLRMVAVGSFKEQKNYSFLVEAFERLPGNIVLDIYGDGPLKKEIQEAIAGDNLNIRLCGLRNDIEKILPSYDLYVMSSLFEGHPVALLEAMACGLPALVSDIPVLREATGNKGLYFDLAGTGDFVQKVLAISGHTIDLDPYAAFNLAYASQTARKEKYIGKLYGLYKAC